MAWVWVTNRNPRCPAGRVQGNIQKPPGGTLGIRTLCATTPFPFLSPSMFTVARSLCSAVSRTGNYAICSLICAPDVSYCRACRSLIARNTSSWLPFLPCHTVPLSLWLQMQGGGVKARFADSPLLFLTKPVRRLHQRQHQPCIWLALGLTHVRHHYHSHSRSTGIIGFFAIPSLLLHLAAATWFVFLFYFPLSFADRFFLSHSHPLLLAPSSCIALIVPLPRAAPSPRAALRHALPSPSPCCAAFAASPLACVASVASRLCHASPVSHRAFIMRRLFCVALRVSHRHVATLVRACRVMLSHAPSPHAPFSPHIRADLRVLSLISRRFCTQPNLSSTARSSSPPTDVDITCMHSTACKGAASCGALFVPPDDTRKRKTGRSSPPKPNS